MHSPTPPAARPWMLLAVLCLGLPGRSPAAPPGPPREFPIGIHAAVAVPGQPLAFALATGSSDVLEIDLAAGTARPRVSLPAPGSLLALSPSGRWLAVANPREVPGGLAEGEVTLVDLTTDEARPPLPVGVLPAGLVVTDSAEIVVSDTLAQRSPDYWSLVMAYQGTNRTFLGQVGANAGTGLTLSTDQRLVYGAEYDLVREFPLDPATGAPANGTMSASISFPTGVKGALHPLADGLHLVSRGGWLHPGTGPAGLLQSTHDFESVTTDPANHAFFAVGLAVSDGESALFQYHDGSFELAARSVLPRNVRWGHRVDDTLYLLGLEPSRTLVYQLANPAAGGSTNQAPTPAFAWNPAAPTTLSMIRFDAGASTDEAPAELLFRWDWEADGRYDTEWSGAPTGEHRYSVDGTRTVRLQVKDRFGAVASLERSVPVTAEADPGIPAETHTPFLLPFRAADLVYQPDSPYAWAADTNGLRLVRLDLRSGLADRQYPLDRWPLRLGLSPDGATMLAALSPSARLLRTGYVAEFHLPTALKQREFPVDTGLNQLLVGPGDLFLGGVTSGDLLVYRRGESKRLDSRASGVVGFARSPSPTNFYLFGAAGLSRWGVNPDTGKLLSEGSFQNAGLVGDDLFLFPGETNALSAVGRLLASAPLGPVAKDLAVLRLVHTGRVDTVAFDVPRRAMFVLGTATTAPPYRTNLYHYHLDSRLLQGTYAVTNGARFVGATPEFVYVAAIRTNGTFFQRVPNPAAGSDSNQPPVARFEFAPAQPTTLVPVAFDASASSDPEDAITDLQFRWDWDGDATFDTAFATQPGATHRFNEAGSHTVTVEVRDGRGASTRLSQTIVVTREEDPGQVPDPAPAAFTLPFAPRALVFDPVRPRLFATDFAGRRLVRMNLDSGVMDREYRLDHYPDSLAIAADGRSLVLTTLLRTDYSTPASARKGFVAHVDLERDVKTHEFGLETVPRSIALTTRGFAIVSGSGVLTASSGLHVYRVAGGERVHRGPPFESTLATVHPDQSRFYAVTTGTSSPVAYPGEILEDGSVTNRAGFGGETMGNWIEMLGSDRLISNRGGLFASSTDPAVDGRFLATLDANVADVAADPARGVFFAAGAAWSAEPFVRLYHATSLQIGWQLPSPPPHPRYLHATPATLYWVGVDANSAVVGQTPSPAIGGESNQPPAARFEAGPPPLVAGQAIQFDAGASTDDGPTASLRYRWDWDADGVFDTPPLAASATGKAFEFGGTRTVVLQVLDAYGATNTFARTLDIALAPGPDGVAFEAPFPASAVQFHSSRPIAYLLDPVGRRLVQVDLATGFTLRERPLAQRFAALALTPDATTLVVAERRRIDADAEGEGTLLVLDPETLATRRSFDVAMDPEHLLATDGGLIVATSGSGQWTRVRSYRRETGEELGSAPMYYHGLPALHPLQRTFYVATTAVNPPSFTRFDLDPRTGAITVRGTSDATQGALFPAPNGTEMLSEWGMLVRASENPDLDLQGIRRITEASFSDVHFDPVSGKTYAVGSYWAVSPPTRLFVLGPDYEVLETPPVPGATRHVHAAPPFVITVEVEANRTVFRRRGGEAPEPPELTARLTGEAGEPVVLVVTGPAGREFVLWRSADLAAWTPVLTNRLDQGTYRFRPPGAEAGSAFFRASFPGN